MSSRKPIKACIYTRVSTPGQEDNTSLAVQYAQCAARAQAEGAQIVAHLEEVKSGGLYQTRGQLQKALALIEAGHADVLILSKLDRTGREVAALRDVRRRVEEAGAQLVFADGMTFEKNAVGNFLFTQMSAVAELEREMIRDRMVAGLERLAGSGKQPARTIPAYGYYIYLKADAIKGRCSWDEVGTYIVREDEARWIKPIFERLAGGHSLRDVAAWLTQQGARTRKGAPWAPGTLYWMSQNEAYVGRPAWRKTRRRVDEGRAKFGVGIAWEEPRPREEWITLTAPALVDEELFERARSMVGRGRTERSGRNDVRYLLTGFVACPVCGRRMHARWGKSAGKHIHLFRCEGAVKRQSQATTTCAFPSVIGEKMSELVIEALCHLLQSPHLVERAVKEYRATQEQKHRAGDDERRLRELEREIETLLKREEVAASKEVEATMNGEDASAFARLRTQSAERRCAAENERASVLSRREKQTIEAAPVEEHVAALVVETLRDETVPDAEKNLMVRRLVEAVYPRLVPPELRVSAKRWRANGCPQTIEGDGGHPYSRHLGGVDIVLRDVHPSATFVLSRHLIGWEATRDKSGRRNLTAQWQTNLRVEEANPFPRQWKRVSKAEMLLVREEQGT